MKSKALFIIMLFLFGCSNTGSPFLNMNYSEIDELLISERIEGTNDWQTYELLDSEHKKKLFANYLYKCDQEPIKFVATCKISFELQGQKIEIFVSGNSIKYDGVSYRCHKNLGDFIKGLK